MAKKVMEEMFEPPPLSGIMAFRGVHVLGTVRYDDNMRAQLTASHYASCLVFGMNPMWGVWSATTGKFLRFYGSRQEIERAYPKLVWRRKMAEWSLLAISDLPPDKRRAVLNERYATKED